MIAVAAALALAQPPPWVPAERLRSPAEAYRELVERYRRGDRAGTVAEPFAPEVALRQVAALREVAEAALCIDCPAHERVRARDLVEAFPLEPAALLHTERALDRLQGTDPAAAAAELEIGLRLVELMGEARRRAFEPRWLRAAALGLSRLGEFDLALKLMEPAMSRYPSDPLLLLARGAALEAKARLHPQAVAARRDLSGRRAASAERDHLLRAEQGYRDALALKPDLHHARVRLGRVRALLGRLDASGADLQAVVASGAGVRDRYLAHLFLGHTREASGRFAEAAAEYAQALRVEPDGQAAAVALSHTLHLQGRVAESVQALRSGVARAGRRGVADPWWPYLAGQWDDAEVVMDALRTDAMMPAVALALLQAPTPPPAPRLVDPRDRPAEWYVAMIDRYRRGEHAAAVSEPLVPEKVLFELSAVKRLAEAAQHCGPCPLRDEVDAFPFEAAVLLHTERALERFEAYDTAAQAEMDVAARVAALMPEERRRAFEPRWLRVASQLLSRLGQWDLAARLLEPAIVRHPGDPLMLLARGAGLEAKAHFAPDTLHVEMALLGRSGRRESAERDHLGDAAKSYRKALALKADLHPARVRLGRVLHLLGRQAASAAELQAVVAGSASRRDRYLAHLFLGQVREAAGRPGDAAAEYVAALRVEPDGQTAAVALSHALHRQGRLEDSVGALRDGVAPAGRRAEADPWWPYLAGQWEDAEALLDALRAEVSR